MKNKDETQAFNKQELLDQLQARAQKKLRSTVRFAKNVRKATRLERPIVTEADLEDSKDDLQLEGLVSSALLFVSALMLLGLSGCCVPIRPAFAAYHEALAPEYRAYVDADESLTDKQKSSRYNMLDAADAALKESE